MRRFAVSIVAAAGIVACSPPPDASPSTSTDAPPPATTDSQPAGAATTEPTGVAAGASFVPGPGRDAQPALDGELDLRRCTWRWFGHYELEIGWHPTDGSRGEAGGVIPVEFFLVAGDTGAGAARGTLALPAPGIHTVAIPVETPQPDPDQFSFRQRAPAGFHCALVSGAAGGGVEIDLAIDPPDGLTPGSLQAQLADFDHNDGLFPLAGLFHELDLRDRYPFDRVYIAPGESLDGVDFQTEGSCLLLTQHYDLDGESVVVQQRRGCTDRAGPEGDRVLRVVDEAWEVLVSGRPGSTDELADRLIGYAVAGADPVTGDPVPSADEFFAGWLADNPGFRLGARFEWEGREVAIVANTDPRGDGRYDAVVFGLEPWNAGGSGLRCHEYTTATSDDGVRGYRYFATGDRAAVFSTPMADGTTDVAELIQGDNGDWYGLLDLADVERTEVDVGHTIAIMFAETAVTRADGSPMPCTQG